VTGVDDAAPVKLWLVRHGQTEWSESRRHTGTTDLPLTEEGEAEARALIPWLSGELFSRVFVSPRQRARKTCELAGLGDRAEVEPDLAEWDYGRYEGVTSKEIHETWPGWNVFCDGAPGGESPADVSARADRLIGHLATLSGNIALFSHGQFCSSLGARWIGVDIAEGRRLALATASVSVLRISPDHDGMRQISVWNATPGRAER
jgi:broad specificity phosphatase PhoE